MLTNYKYKFKKGQIVHLDDVYDILGIIPSDTYNQDDPGAINSSNDAGETLKFIKNVEISINIKVNGKNKNT